jgi:4-hydroxy-tetrahydrodipicolinate synthase
MEAAMTLSRTMIRGLLPALTTPLDRKGAVDAKATKAQVDHLVAGGASGLVPVGGTGEYTALSPADRAAMVEATVAAARGRVPVIAGVLSPGLRDAIAAGRDFIKAGADGLMVLAPYYITPTQAGIRDYFKAYADAIGGPVMLYEIPYRTGVSLKPETIAEMAADGTIVGMKASNPDMAQFSRIMALAGDKLSVTSGEEMLFPIEVAMGAVGGVLASAILFPRIWIEIFNLAKAGNLKGALAKHRPLAPFLAAVFSECNPGPLKAAQAITGLSVGEVLCPLQPPKPELVAHLKSLMAPLLAYERELTTKAA